MACLRGLSFALGIISLPELARRRGTVLVGVLRDLGMVKFGFSTGLEVSTYRGMISPDLVLRTEKLDLRASREGTA